MQNVFLESHNIKNLNFGFGKFNYHLIKELNNEMPQDFRITLHSKDIKTLKDEFGNTFDYKKYYGFRRYKPLSIRKRYDLWHSMNQNISIEPYHNDIPYLLTVHNISHIKDEKNYKNEKNHILFQEKLNRSDSIVYISNYAKSSTHKYFNVPKVNEHVIYNGNTIPKITLNEDYTPNFKTTQPYLFTIGEITYRKNFKSLIAFLIALKNKDYNLIIAGKKNTKAAKEIEDLITKYNLSHRVHLLGKISEIEKQYYYKNCEAFVFPSLREGFGLPIIEAMTFKKPVFLSNNTSLPEIGGDIAFYWDNYDPTYMADVFENGMNTFSKNENNHKEQLKKRADLFSWSNAAKAYIDIYKRLLNHTI
ncbi:MAG: glycosyltransferase family 4 protein [Flavobacteriaceae bacterium]|nr:glycosyltransferase family 4 protein [Flavobacteriaceae bacterium]